MNIMINVECAACANPAAARGSCKMRHRIHLARRLRYLFATSSFVIASIML